MSNKLADCTPALRDKIAQMIVWAAQRGIGVIVIDTVRTEAEQQANIANGVSWTKQSKHLPGEDGLARACDLAPQVCTTLKNWAPEHPYWKKLGEIGESLGLKWGGRWKHKDMGHFEV